MSSPAVRKMLNEVKFHKAQYSELRSIFAEEWQKHFSEDWTNLEDSKVESMLREKNLTDLLAIFQEMGKAQDEGFNSVTPLRFGT